VSRIFRNRTDPSIVSTVEQIRKKLKSDKRSILVKDLGSRSELSDVSLRRVSDIARNSPVPGKYGRLLSSLAAEFGKPMIIELGTSLGISTMYMAASCSDAHLITVEGCPATAAIAKQNFIEAGIENVEVLVGSFDEILPGFERIGIKPGLVFIDGNHRKEPVVKYFKLLAELSDSRTVIIIDDINYSKEMSEAWCEIKLHDKVTVSMDLHRIGILFFRQAINHNDYIIRY
jgi:predicted O-methyltransferase YrrM